MHLRHLVLAKSAVLLYYVEDGEAEMGFQQEEGDLPISLAT